MFENTQQPTTLSSFSQFNGSLLSRRPVAAQVAKFVETAKKMADESSTGTGYDQKIIAVTKEDDKELYCASVVLAVRESGNTNSVVAYHTILLADTAARPEPVFRTIQGETIEIMRVFGDANDERYRAAVKNAVRREFPTAARLLDAEAEVLPQGYNFEDTNLVRATLVSAFNAATTILNSSASDFKDVSLPKDADKLNVQARLLFNQPEVSDSVGNPVRCDVRIDFTEVVGQQQQQAADTLRSLNSGEAVNTLFTVGGFMDLVWNPVNNGVYNPYMQYQQVAQASPSMPWKYQARMVITHIDPALTTIPGILLGLASVLQLPENNNWMGGFKHPYSEGIDLHDIGAIGLEVNVDPTSTTGIGTRFDTRSDSFKDYNLATLLATFLRPEVLISMDVEECGSTTWLTSPLLSAARGNVEARQAIISAARMLTNGKFEYTGNVVDPDNNRIHLGYYTEKGVRHDIRTIDHLAILNMLGDKDSKAAGAWSDTFARTDFPLEVRMHHRKKILDGLLTNPVYTGFAQRITFDPAFLIALAKGINAAGLRIRPNTPAQDMSGQQRAAATWLTGKGLATGSAGSLFTVPLSGMGFNQNGVVGWGRYIG